MKFSMHLEMRLSGPFRCSWSRQRHWISEFHDLPHALGIDNRNTRKTDTAVFDKDFPRLWNQVVQPFQRDVEHVVLAIISQTQKRQPFRFHLITEIERHDLDLGLLGAE